NGSSGVRIHLPTKPRSRFVSCLKPRTSAPNSPWSSESKKSAFARRLRRRSNGINGKVEEMTQLSEHPSVKRFRDRTDIPVASPAALNAGDLKQICLEAGADDVGFVDLDRPELADQRSDIVHFFPHTKSLISFVLRMNREPIHNPARSVANLEFHQTGDRVNETAHRIVTKLR